MPVNAPAPSAVSMLLSPFSMAVALLWANTPTFTPLAIWPSWSVWLTERVATLLVSVMGVRPSRGCPSSTSSFEHDVKPAAMVSAAASEMKSFLSCIIFIVLVK